MTTLNNEIPYLCIYKIDNGTFSTICDKQCISCKKYQTFKPKIR